MQTVEMYARVEGYVQGVGFRASVRSYAQQLGLLGTVQNLPDGSVEMYVQGREGDIQELFQWLDQEFGSRYIKGIHRRPILELHSYKGFVILYT